LRVLKKRSEFGTAAVFLLPSALGFTVFVLAPVIFSFLVSLTNYKGSFASMKFIGLANFEVLFTDEKFWHSLSVTLIFVAAGVVFELLLGFVFALLLNGKLLGKTFFRSILFLPVVLSSVAVSIAFLFIFHPSSGPVNRFLEWAGLSAVPWLKDKSTALLTIIIVFVWQSFGYYMIIFLSGLQSVDPSLYEAADMDGASGIRKVLHVTLPALSPIIFLSFVIAIINSFKAFDQIYLMTGGQYGGGPADSTRVLAFDIYRNGFLFWQVGYGAAESVVLFLIVALITFVQNRLQDKWVNYDAR
jgi:multiple sugar transport system permease protein